jgi:hypothetical protein
VWLFGAGASHHYNLNPWGVPVPLANDLGAATLERRITIQKIRQLG